MKFVKVVVYVSSVLVSLHQMCAGTLPFHNQVNRLDRNAFVSLCAVFGPQWDKHAGTPYSNCSYQMMECHWDCVQVQANGDRAVLCSYQYSISLCAVGAPAERGCHNPERCDGLGAPFSVVTCSCD